LYIKEIYKIDPLDRYSYVYRPSHRKTAKSNRDYNEVYIGIAGKRKITEQLVVKRQDGSHFAFFPSYLYFNVLPTGEIYVQFIPFAYAVDSEYINNVKQFILENYDAFSILMNLGMFTYDDGDDFDTIENRLKTGERFLIKSYSHYFPIENQDAIFRLIMSFVLLFPILDTCYDLAIGNIPMFKDHFNNLKAWSNNQADELEQNDIDEAIPPQLPELDSYQFVRAGLWYQVLVRDNWTCCSCRRSAKEHGIVLHVDHILPRSLGGKDELQNLQTLCLKCNLGKSNKDTTDLRSII
jgi:hypothetical protein